MSDIAISVEKQYTINEVSDLLKMSFSTVRLLVKDEPGVLRFQTSKRGAAKRTRADDVQDTRERSRANYPALHEP
jgi:hypothetical protein